MGSSIKHFEAVVNIIQLQYIFFIHSAFAVNSYIFQPKSRTLQTAKRFGSFRCTI